MAFLTCGIRITVMNFAIVAIQRCLFAAKKLRQALVNFIMNTYSVKHTHSL